MLLRSIPPANRRSPTPIAIGVRQLSSMRAATAAGLTMVGGQAKPGSAPIGETFRPKATCPDPRRQKQKEVYYSDPAHIRQLKELLDNANDPKKPSAWKQQIERPGW